MQQPNRRRQTERHPPARRSHARLAAASALCAAALLIPHASAATYTFDNPLGGAINVSTNFSPVGTPGASDVLIIDDLPRIFTNTTLTVPTNQAIAGITYSHYGQTVVNGPGVLTLQNGALGALDAIKEVPGGTPLNSLFINASVAGSNGLTKNGRGFFLLNGTNTLSGTISISGIFPDTTSGGPSGLAITTDAALGVASNAVTLSNGGILRFASGVTSARTITVGSVLGGVMESYGATTLNGTINGVSAITVQGNTGGSVTFGSPSVLSVGLVIRDGATASLLGTMTGTSGAGVRGTLNLGNGTTGPASNAIVDTAGVSMSGGTLRVYAGATNTSETIGTLTLQGGSNTIELNANVNGGVALNASSLASSAPLFVRGRGLGSAALAANTTLLTFATAPTLVGGGGTTTTNRSIAPNIIGNANVTGGVSQVSVVDAGLVTYGANGIRPLNANEYASTIGSAATDNVRISDGVATQTSAATMNALVVRDTMVSNGNSGITGSGTLTVTSGAIAAVSDLNGEELFIDNPLNFNAARGIVHTTPTADGQSQLTLRGTIIGTGGLAKAGLGDVYLTNTASTYTGVTSVYGGSLIVSGDVPSGGPSALGASTDPVFVGNGANDNSYTQLLLATPGSIFARSLNIETSGLSLTSASSPSQLSSTNSLATIGTRGGVGSTFSGNISVNGGFLNLLGDADRDNVLTISGSVFGSNGGLQEQNVAFPQFQIVRLSGSNNYGVGTIIRGGEWQAGSNTAFGTGTIYFAGNNAATPTGAISAFGAARTIANALVFREAPVFAGSDALTFTGAVDLGSVNQQVYVSNTADTTFSGNVGRGGVIKRGDGRLVLSGAANSYNGQTIVYEGALRAASNSALGVAAGNVNPTQGTFIVNTGSLELAGGITTSEAIFLGSGTIPIAAANPLGNLRSVSGNNTITESIAFDDVGTVGVDAGGSLTLAGDTIDNTGDLTAALRKVGGGTLAVKNVRLNTLDVQAGTVRVAVGSVPSGTSRVSNLSVAAGALLDLTNNSLIYDYTSTSPQSAVRTMLQQGLIDTTAGGANGAVGYAEAAAYFPAGQVYPAPFAGQTVDNTTLLLIYTLTGDATLNKTVDFDDLLRLAQNYGGTNKVWRDGDFTYDGSVGFDDLLELAKAYNQTAPVSAAAFEAQVGEGFAADWALAQSLVPEPTTLAAAALLMPLARRRRA